MADRIQIKRSTVPGLAPDRTELLAGELALNRHDLVLYALDDQGIVQPIAGGGGGGSSSYTLWVKTATGGETVFDGLDDSGIDLDINLGGFNVLLNGISLDPTADYSAEDDKVTLSSPVAAGDIVTVRCLKAVSPGQTTGVYTTQVYTENTRPASETIQPDFQNITTQYLANWWLYYEIEDVRNQVGNGTGNGTVDLSGYATIAYSDAADEEIRGDVANLTLNLAAERQARIDTDASLQSQIDNITIPDHSNFATTSYVDAGDNATLQAAKAYSDSLDHSGGNQPGTIVADTEPAGSPNGTNWFDTVRLELFVRASDAWLPSSPLGARVTQGEIVQAQLLERVATGEQNQNKIMSDVRGNSNDISSMNIRVQQNSGKIANNEQAIEELKALPDPVAPDVDKEYVDSELAKKIGNTGEQVLPTATWKIRARKVADDGNYSYIAIENDQLKLYHVADPTNDEHGVSRGYCDRSYSKKQVPVVMKTNGSLACTTANIPPSKSFCGLYNTSPGSSTNGNPYFGNWNSDIRVNIDGLKNPENQQFAVGEYYNISGFVSIFGAEDGKLYFKHAITNVARSSSHEYVQIHFASRIPAWGWGQNTSQSKFVLTVEGLMDKTVNTVDVPVEGI